jgi:hypothetical protein
LAAGFFESEDDPPDPEPESDFLSPEPELEPEDSELEPEDSEPELFDSPDPFEPLSESLLPFESREAARLDDELRLSVL